MQFVLHLGLKRQTGEDGRLGCVLLESDELDRFAEVGCDRGLLLVDQTELGVEPVMRAEILPDFEARDHRVFQNLAVDLQIKRPMSVCHMSLFLQFFLSVQWHLSSFRPVSEAPFSPTPEFTDGFSNPPRFKGCAVRPFFLPGAHNDNQGALNQYPRAKPL